jgi:hypothetical protein
VPAIVVHVTDHITQSVSWLQVASPALAAAAAGASWRAVFIARRAQLDADQPQLVFNIRTSDASQQPGFPVTLTLENVGRGIAVFPGFVVTSGDGRGCNRIVERNLAHGDGARFGLPFPTSEDAMGIAFCEDRYNNVHVWSARRRYRRYKKGKRKDLTPRVMLDALYDGRSHEIDSQNLQAAHPIAD